jgi:hypothetical protein
LKQNANLPAGELVELRQGSDFGRLECYYDVQKKLVSPRNLVAVAGKAVGICAQKVAPIAAFSIHFALNDMLIYEGSQLPSAYIETAPSLHLMGPGTALRNRRAVTISCFSRWPTARLSGRL